MTRTPSTTLDEEQYTAIDRSSTTPTGTGGTGTSSGDPLADAGATAGETVGEVAQRATDIGMRRADQGKDQAAQTIHRLADSIREVSTDIEADQPQIAGVARTAAEQAERFAGYLERTDARQMLNSVEDAARRQPLLFVGGAFALGVVAARILKAGGGNADGSRSGYGPYRPGQATDFSRPVGSRS